MHLPVNHILEKKAVKHARIKVFHDGQVRVIVPNSFSDEDISALISKKSQWIVRQQEFFSKKVSIKLEPDQLLLFGSRYSYFYDNTYSRKIVIDHNFKTIRAKTNLLDPQIRKKWYKSEAKKYLIPRTQELAANLRFDFNKIYIRDQKTRWGSCSGYKNISFNWRIIKAPQSVSDYIIIHELVHTKIMNHSAKFHTLLKSLYPDCKDAVSWLDKYGNSL